MGERRVKWFKCETPLSFWTRGNLPHQAIERHPSRQKDLHEVSSFCQPHSCQNINKWSLSNTVTLIAPKIRLSLLSSYTITLHRVSTVSKWHRVSIPVHQTYCLRQLLRLFIEKTAPSVSIPSTTSLGSMFACHVSMVDVLGQETTLAYTLNDLVTLSH